MVVSPLETLDRAFNDHDFVMLVCKSTGPPGRFPNNSLADYRGHWCPFCLAWLRELQELSGSIAAKNGALFIITAEDASFLAKTRKLTGYNGEAISDPKHTVANFLRERGLVDVAVTSRAGYSDGVAQPAVLVALQDRTPIYQWAIAPSMMNLGGAKDRPSLSQVVDNVFAELEGRSAVHRTIKLMTLWQGLSAKLFPPKSLNV